MNIARCWEVGQGRAKAGGGEKQHLWRRLSDKCTEEIPQI